jgi:hypothetical protein
MTETTFEKLRETVCRDAGLPASAAASFQGETVEVVAREALSYARERRGPAGEAAVRQSFAAADARESPDDIRARIARDLQLSSELRGQLSTATTTERQIADDALAILRQSGGEAALDQGVRRLQERAIDSDMRGTMARRRVGTAPRVDLDGKVDMDAWLRSTTGHGRASMPAAGDQ